LADKFYYGGQAIIEGVVMRGRKAMATAVRRPNGDIVVDTVPLAAVYTGRVRKLPFLRGIIVLLETLVLGVKTLIYSANVSLDEEGEKITTGMVLGLLAISLSFTVGLFFIAPLLLTKLLDPYIGSSFVFSLIEGVIRVAIFLAYLGLIGRMADIKRVFAYHGAEHKVVNAFEAGVPLEVAAVKEHSTTHVRCGTSFMFSVLILAIIVFALIGRPSFWLMLLSRVVLIPVIAAIGYEINHFGALHADNALVRMMLAPGWWLQSLTTRQPDDGQLEVALSALKRVVEIDRLAEVAAVQASSA